MPASAIDASTRSALCWTHSASAPATAAAPDAGSLLSTLPRNPGAAPPAPPAAPAPAAPPAAPSAAPASAPASAPAPTPRAPATAGPRKPDRPNAAASHGLNPVKPDAPSRIFCTADSLVAVATYLTPDGMVPVPPIALEVVRSRSVGSTPLETAPFE